MKRIRKCGIAFGVIGVVLLAVLVGIGAFVNNTLQKAPLAQLVFEVGDDNQHCSVSTSYYYFWNLTNKPETISGAKANFNLLGPYAFDSHSCTIDEEITSSTQLAYRTIEKGTFFNAEASKGSMYDEVTGANLAYITVLSKTGGEDGLLVAITGPGLQTIIETMQTPDFIQQVTVGSIPLVLSTIRSQSTAGLFVPLAAGGVSTQVIGGVVTNSNATLFAFFNDPAFELTTPISLKGYANWLTTIGQVTPINIPDDLAYVLYNSWISTSGASIFMFAADTAAVAAEFGIPTPIADQLKSYFGAYLLNPDTFDSATVYGISENLFYAQWTDGKYLEDGVLSQEGIPTALGYFEVGLPAPTGISEATAIQLWDPMSNYSLTSTNGIALWMGAAANATLIGKIATAYPTLNQTQIITVLTWLGTFYNNIAPILIKQSFGISDFSDLAYAQWGGMVLGQSLKELGNLDFTPEIAAFDSSIKYTAAQAKALLNGTYPLYDAKNIGALLTLVQSGSWSDINGMFGINATQAVGLAQYLNYIMGNLAAPIVMEATAEGSGLFVTRTVQEWLFTAHDPLLVALKEKNTGASIDSNTTDDLAAVRLKPKSTKKIYTKDATIDDLHASLMKQANPPIISDYAENFTVTGYTGTQFMPYNDVDTPKYPFEFWLGQIDRPLPLKNAGTADYKGVEVRHMVVSNDGFKSSAEDPSMAKFYQHITGMWNISALPPGTPLFVSRVEFAGADESVKENIMLTDNVTGEPVLDITNLKSTSIKGQWMQVEPFLGTTINANVAIQLSVKIDSSTLTRFNPNVRSMYAPVFWGRSGGQATEEDVNMIKTVLYGARLIWKALVGLGVGIGVVFMIIGIVMYIKGGKTKVVRLK